MLSITTSRPGGIVKIVQLACPYVGSTSPVPHEALKPLRAARSVSTKTGELAELARFTVGVPLMLTVGVPTLALTVGVPEMLTASGVFVTFTGMLGVGGAAASGTRLGLAPTVPVVIKTATVARTTRPKASERLLLSGIMDSSLNFVRATARSAG